MLADWTEIEPAADALSLNVKRADATHPLDFRIGRDFRGRYAFQLDASDCCDSFQDLVSPGGFEVLVEARGDRRVRLTLLLNDMLDFEIFKVLCEDLLEVTRGLASGQSAEAAEMMVARLRQWEEVFARRRRKSLSRSEIMGLVGELIVLRDLIAPRVGLALAASSWRGPYGAEQDFEYGGTIVEVKTQGTTSDRRMKISSEDQLDTSAGRVILCQQGIATCGDHEGESLNGIVDGLLADAGTHAPTSAKLESCLAVAGWQRLPEYDDAWRFVDRQFYEVREGFPRIVRSGLPTGVERVTYSIRTADCLPFRVEQADALSDFQA